MTSHAVTPLPPLVLDRSSSIIAPSTPCGPCTGHTANAFVPSSRMVKRSNRVVRGSTAAFSTENAFPSSIAEKNGPNSVRAISKPPECVFCVWSYASSHTIAAPSCRKRQSVARRAPVTSVNCSVRLSGSTVGSINHRIQAIWQHAGQIAGQAAAGNVGSAMQQASFM